MAKILGLVLLAFVGWTEVDEKMIDEEISSAEAEADQAEIIQKAVRKSEKAKKAEVESPEPSEIEHEIAKLRHEVAQYQRQKKITDERIRRLEQSRKPASAKAPVAK